MSNPLAMAGGAPVASSNGALSPACAEPGGCE